jgi:hypothetical protein
MARASASSRLGTGTASRTCSLTTESTTSGPLLSPGRRGWPTHLRPRRVIPLQGRGPRPAPNVRRCVGRANACGHATSFGPTTSLRGASSAAWRKSAGREHDPQARKKASSRAFKSCSSGAPRSGEGCRNSDRHQASPRVPLAINRRVEKLAKGQAGDPRMHASEWQFRPSVLAH